ncbi:MAG TPA: type II toxin-antitoxin system VapC family toxin, partial [Protaetiibacter sp.]|nr:type II toxin-antitoxin system VapC family toxin [Protaetiibacter sp.]
MALVYFDASAFVKLLVSEDGSDLAGALWDGADAILSSRIAFPEVCAALGAAERDHRIAPSARRRAVQTWQELWREVRAVEVTD